MEGKKEGDMGEARLGWREEVQGRWKNKRERYACIFYKARIIYSLSM